MRRLAYVAAGLLWSITALAFANLPIGVVVDNDTLPGLTGGEQKLLGETNVSVFIFFKPGMEHSNQALAQIADCQKQMADKPVHWCAIVSDRAPAEAVTATVRAIGLQMPVLIDRGDALYGKLGVVLHPVIGITDEHRRLVAYQPFAKVNYEAIMRAQIRHALKEITDAELDEVLKPRPALVYGDTSVAHRFLRLAEKQFQATNYNQALTNAGKSIEKLPTAAAWILQGRILQAQGKLREAKAAFESALKLDPDNAVAQEAVRSIAGPGQ